MSRQMGIPCLFTIHNIHTVKSTLSHIEDRGIDAAYFWHHLYYENPPYDYEHSWESNPVDFLVSGVFSAHFVNTVSPTFLKEVVEGRHEFVSENLERELANKTAANCSVGILNAPDPVFNPETDHHLLHTYTHKNFTHAKQKNKQALQVNLGLIKDPGAPLFFWPSRLDPNQKGCQLLAEILYHVISTYWDDSLQIVFVANGEYQGVFRDIVSFHNLHKRVAVCDFRENLEHQAYAASDFILMPSRFEPCGLPQMIAPLYGSLPVVHDTGGIHDTIFHIDVENSIGNGFVFETYDANGLWWAIKEAMRFYRRPVDVRNTQIERIMQESAETFTHAATARRYIELYERMLQRPLISASPY
jgi:starch synthase/alpha-amylase